MSKYSLFQVLLMCSFPVMYIEYLWASDLVGPNKTLEDITLDSVYGLCS